MTNFELTTPVCITIFRRPEKTRRLIQELRRAQPPELYIIADGPRAGHDEEASLCAEARAAIDDIDWPCIVHKRWLHDNVGIKKCLSDGFNWLFEQVEEAIVLEDDLVPEPSFFRYCQEMLAYYRHDSRVFAVCGSNLQLGQKRLDASYYLSRRFCGRGWASWSRAWKFYDVDMTLWPLVRDKGWLHDALVAPRNVALYSMRFDGVHSGKANTWDHQFEFASMSQNMVCAFPNVNLILNLGHGPDAAHNHESIHPFVALPTEPMIFPLRHPTFMIPDLKADERVTRITHPSWAERLHDRLARLVTGRQHP